MSDKNIKQKTIDTSVTILAMNCSYLAKFALMVTQDSGCSDQFNDQGKLVFLSIMSNAIFTTLRKQDESEEIAGIWQELSVALSDIAGGKSSELFRPLKNEGAQPRRISVHREMYFSIAAAVYDLAPAEEKEIVTNRIAKNLNVKPSQLGDFRKNLTRGNPNIKSTDAIGFYDAVSFGHLIADKNGKPWFGPGKPSPVANWLKWFDNL